MGAVKQSFLASLEEECGTQLEPKLLRGSLSPTPSQSAPPPVPSPKALTSAVPPRGLSPTKLMIASSVLCMKTRDPVPWLTEKSFKTVEGTLLAPGSIFDVEGGPYYEYLDDRGRKAVESLAVTGAWIFAAYCSSSHGEWIEAQRNGSRCRLFVTPRPPTSMMPGLVLAPYVIHELFWRNQV